ncbi:glycosyl hydrolases family 31-domain-containing protein, partial [Fimicolochytrium jonesii]|uniref:glycosyl hydrolases family 31-domain-containing protein n=1 Tax=Fimicolochytrium jonesii TaxID=1396493 RepID=UPI0022FE785B
MVFKPLVAATLAIAALARGVVADPPDFHNCTTTPYCVRNRNIADTRTAANSPYSLWSAEFDHAKNAVVGKIYNSKAQKKLTFKLSFLKNTHAARFIVNEENPAHVRYDGAYKHAFQHDPKNIDLSKLEKKETEKTILVKYGAKEVLIQKKPFKLTARVDGKPIAEVNSKGWFNFENSLKKKEGDNWETITEVNDWVDKTGIITYTDKHGNRPTSVAADITFPGFDFVTGIPEHASPSLNLKSTRGADAYWQDPYRFWNTDTYAYPVPSNAANYGAIPLIIAQKPGQAAGIFWVNPAEAWVDISRENNSTTTHFMSEDGVIDLVFFFGKSALEVSRSYAELTGSQQLPQRFALGYHQCRYSYMNTSDVLAVDSGFDEHSIPYDVMWLDIDHTSGMRYFTWNHTRFEDPVGLQNYFGEKKHRQMVTIKDPHLAKDSKYFAYKQFLNADLLMKTANKSVYEGKCWPSNIDESMGRTLAVWPDWLNPNARSLWASFFSYEKYPEQTKYLFTWNDMNEPAVFAGPDKSSPRDNLHVNGVEHRAVHNMVGSLMLASSYLGHLKKEKYTQRPFILTRSFFAGSQRYGAMWMGDSKSTWEHLQVASPTLQGLALGGYGFAGGDIGGFISEPGMGPGGELLTRWYNSAVFTGFFRGHSDKDSARREPWVYGEPYTTAIRKAIRLRYTLLPYIYTEFFSHAVQPYPLLRPMFASFPQNPQAYEYDDQYFFGSSILVKPVAAPNVTKTTIYIAEDQSYYNLFDWAKVDKKGLYEVEAPWDTIAAFVRGGTVLPTRFGVTDGSSKTHSVLPLEVIVAVSKEGTASGKIYHDDGTSFENQKGAYIWKEVSLEGKTIKSCDVLAGKKSVYTNGLGEIPFSPKNHFQKRDPTHIKYVSLVGYKEVKSAKLVVNGKAKNVAVHVKGNKTKIEVNVRLGDDWEVVL